MFFKTGFLKVSQYLKENTCIGLFNKIAGLQRDSNIDVFLLILRNFNFYRIPSVAASEHSDPHLSKDAGLSQRLEFSSFTLFSSSSNLEGSSLIICESSFRKSLSSFNSLISNSWSFTVSLLPLHFS